MLIADCSRVWERDHILALGDVGSEMHHWGDFREKQEIHGCAVSMSTSTSWVLNSEVGLRTANHLLVPHSAERTRTTTLFPITHMKWLTLHHRHDKEGGGWRIDRMKDHFTDPMAWVFFKHFLSVAFMFVYAQGSIYLFWTVYLRDRRPAELGVEPRINLQHVWFRSTSKHMNLISLNWAVRICTFAA